MDDTIIVLPLPPAAPSVYQWYLDIGDFFDRFGEAQMPALLSTDPTVQALIKNIQSRKWVDLQRADVAAALDYMAGVTVRGLGTISTPIAGMTAALVTSILTTQPAAHEQFALVKMYFT